MRSGRPLRRYLMQEVNGVDIGRKPPQRASKPYGGPARAPKYLQWLRTQPCASCGSIQGVQAAHTGSDGGMRIKASDSSAIPLCAGCHICGPDAYHRVGRKEFEVRTGINCAAAAAGYYGLWTGTK